MVTSEISPPEGGLVGVMVIDESIEDDTDEFPRGTCASAEVKAVSVVDAVPSGTFASSRLEKVVVRVS